MAASLAAAPLTLLCVSLETPASHRNMSSCRPFSHLQMQSALIWLLSGPSAPFRHGLLGTTWGGGDSAPGSNEAAALAGSAGRTCHTHAAHTRTYRRADTHTPSTCRHRMCTCM